MVLLQDPSFRQVGRTDRGTILIIASYKEAYMQYKKAIRNLPQAFQGRLGVEARLAARTIDTVQGGEDDIVFLDLVRSSATEFTDDPNRLCVALTRARQAEVSLMNPGSKLAFLSTFSSLASKLR
jgi:regulator of nonsense transcripts 1